ncbi:RHS repeat-associated core domain-containing protein [Chromobacterium vaccinii]|uniref:RHS repeat-associated core domain-containing protein n=1 Tax=Chromobacterium vaccinii TaxID=1108595 RepID=UPI003C76FC9B
MDNCAVGFNGERADPVSGDILLGNGCRAYHPALMRFGSADELSPFGGGGVNGYGYCEGDPVNRCDPSGHFSVGGAIGIGLGVAGVLLTPLSFGGSLAAAMSIAAVVAGVVSVGLGIAAEVVEPGKTAEILGWTGMALGVASGIGAIAAGRLLPEARSIVGVACGKLLPGFSGRPAAGLAARTLDRNPPSTTAALDALQRLASPPRRLLYPRDSMADEVQLAARADQVHVLGMHPQRPGLYTMTDLAGTRSFYPDDSYSFIVRQDREHEVLAVRAPQPGWPPAAGVVGHTSMARDAGGESYAGVYFAGELRFRNGVLDAWTNGSGHYKPPAQLAMRNLTPPVRKLLPMDKFLEDWNG